MSNFIKIVKNYENICRIGKEIINHKDLVRRACPTKLDDEFKKQEERINNFIKATEKAEEEWKTNPYSTNEYWTGWS